MHQISKFFVSTCSLFVIISCQQGFGTASSAFSSANSRAASSQQVFDTFYSTQNSTNYQNFLNKLGNMTLADQYQLSINNATNDTLQIDAYVWSGVSDDLMVIEELFSNLAGKYYLLSDYWDAIGFDPGEQINQANFEEGLAAMDKGMQIQNQATDVSSLTVEEKLATARAYIVFRSMGQNISNGAQYAQYDASAIAGQWLAPLMEVGRSGSASSSTSSGSNCSSSDTVDQMISSNPDQLGSAFGDGSSTTGTDSTDPSTSDPTGLGTGTDPTDPTTFNSGMGSSATGTGSCSKKLKVDIYGNVSV